MRRWAGIFAVSGLGVEAATFALWPQYIDATLSLSVDTDEWLLLQITWVPATDTQSSTFDHFLASSSRFDGMSAVGIYLQARLREEADWSAINETRHERIENNVRGVLQNTVPSFEILPSLSKGMGLAVGCFLAKSFCDFRAWKTSNPLEEILRKPAAGSSSICYSSSFPFSPKSEGASFYSRAIRAANEDSVDFGKSMTERTLFEAQQPFQKGKHEPRLALMKFSRSSTSATIEAEYLETWIARPSNSDGSFRAALPIGKSKSDVLVVTSIASDLDFDKLELAWLQRDGKRVVPASPPSVLEIRAPKTTVVASLQAAIAGEGFHRRYAMDVEILESEVCGGFSKNKTILVRVPISNTAYIDLDEIRIMERFGELKLLSFTKHIEIERPSPVSSQHVVGLEFIMFVPSNNQAHFEFPIHFRYQAPSESELYRQAPVIAPDIFLFCRDGDNSAREKRNPSDDDAAFSYFKVSKVNCIAPRVVELLLILLPGQQTWGLSDRGVSRSGSHWLRLTAVSPLPVVEVLTPVGYLPSAWLVSSMTLFFATMGAAILVWVSVGMANAQSASACAGASWKGKAD
ncbi:Glycosylphosphatidylinositol-mannosyltransferase I, PIG-X/PBN1 [Phytophthora cactorum]|nr:Glycosylphosphatidylinositol-mannosyltransferase I, PIG-X/PBN1 [Phytophthora cactorum]